MSLAPSAVCLLCLLPLRVEEEEGPTTTTTLEFTQLCESLTGRRVKKMGRPRKKSTSTPPESTTCSFCSPCAILIQAGVEIQAQIALLESDLKAKVGIIRGMIFQSGQNPPEPQPPPHDLDKVWEMRDSFLLLTKGDEDGRNADLAQPHVQVKVEGEELCPPPPDSPSSFFLFPDQGGEEECYKQENPQEIDPAVDWDPDFADHDDRDPLDLGDSQSPPKKRRMNPSWKKLSRRSSTRIARKSTTTLDTIPKQENGGSMDPSLNPRVVITPIKLVPPPPTSTRKKKKAPKIKQATKKCKAKKVEAFKIKPPKKPERRYPCPICGKTFGRLGGVGAHLFMKHETEDKPLTCPQPECGKGFTLQLNLDRHLELHKLEETRPLVCEVCDRRWSTQAVLEKHLATHKVLSCSDCGRGFISAVGLRKHAMLHTGERPFPCPHPGCGEAFIDTSRRGLHFLKAHTPQIPPEKRKRFLCPICGKTSKTAGVLKSHLNWHAGKNLRSCAECGVKFQTPQSLKTHQIKEHGHSPLICDECGAVLMSINGLKLHKMSHAGIKKYKCETCGREFLSGHSYRQHQASHRKERPHICQHCGKGFKVAQGLRYHMRSIHEGGPELKHACPHCDLKFPRKDIMQGHVNQVHTGERPFVCHVCNAGFPLKMRLSQHLKTHGINPTIPRLDRLPRSTRDDKGISSTSRKSGHGRMSDSSTSTSNSMDGDPNQYVGTGTGSNDQNHTLPPPPPLPPLSHPYPL